MTLPTSMYGRPLFLVEPNGVPRNRQDQVRGDSMDLKSGSKSVKTAPAFPNVRREWEFMCMNRTEIKEIEDFFFDRQGKLKPFWMPTWQWEVDVTGELSITIFEYWMKIRKFGYLENIWPLGEQYRHIGMWNPTRDHFAAMHIHGADDDSYVSGDEEFLAFSVSSGDFGLPGNMFTEANGYRNSFLRSVRFDDDELVIEYRTQGVAVIHLSTVELPKETGL